MDRYRIEWQDGPRVVGGDTWVIDLDLLRSSGRSPFRFAKKLQVVATTDDVARLGAPSPDWTFWRALVSVAVAAVIRRVDADELQLEHPRTPMQLAPDVVEAQKRSAAMATGPAATSELISEFAAG
jgi:hypothetical protein